MKKIAFTILCAIVMPWQLGWVGAHAEEAQHPAEQVRPETPPGMPAEAMQQREAEHRRMIEQMQLKQDTVIESPLTPEEAARFEREKHDLAMQREKFEAEARQRQAAPPPPSAENKPGPQAENISGTGRHIETPLLGVPPTVYPESGASTPEQSTLKHPDRPMPAEIVGSQTPAKPPTPPVPPPAHEPPPPPPPGKGEEPPLPPPPSEDDPPPPPVPGSGPKPPEPVNAPPPPQVKPPVPQAVAGAGPIATIEPKALKPGGAVDIKRKPEDPPAPNKALKPGGSVAPGMTRTQKPSSSSTSSSSKSKTASSSTSLDISKKTSTIGSVGSGADMSGKPAGVSSSVWLRYQNGTASASEKRQVESKMNANKGFGF